MPKKTTKRRGRGEGSIYQRADGYWTAMLVVGINPKTGRPLRKAVYGKSKQEVTEKLQQLHEKRKTSQLPTSRKTLKEEMQWWLDCTVKAKVDASTLDLYRQRVNDYIIPHLGAASVADITTYHVETFLQQMADQSADLRRKTGEILRRFYTYAVKRRIVTENVAKEATLPKVTKKKMNPLDERQLQAFLAEARKNRHYDLYVLAVDSGARQGELFALEWTDLDFQTGILTITKTLQLHNGHHKLKEVKTPASRRRIRLTPYTLDLLSKRKAKSKSRLIFPNRKGNYLQRENIRKHSLHKILARAGLPQIRFHDLRHTHATLALLKTKNVKAVSARLGHSDIRVTLNVYAHYLPVMEDELVDAMNYLVTPQAQPQPPSEATIKLQTHFCSPCPDPQILENSALTE